MLTFHVVDVVPVNFQDEKVRYEVAVMRHVAANTSIPVPHVYHYGMAAENPLGLGPFIIMDYIEHYQSLSSALRDPDRPVEKHPVLNPIIDEARLTFFYKQVAQVLLQLDGLRFPCIGSLVEDKASGNINVKGRPLLANMIELVIHTDAPAEDILPLPSTTYSDSDAWFSALADIHMAQLAFQRRDLVEDADDARDKYVARQLFRQVAAEGRYSPSDNDNDNAGSSQPAFALFSEDLRPANILLDKDDNIVGVIDWEFAYAAPLSFSSCPPWWLLMEEPESWSPGGLVGWQETYEPRLQTFLGALEDVEKKEKKQAPPSGEPLSQRMRTSWATKAWMRNYAARRSWAFDFLWWKHLDEVFFGPNEDQDHKVRLSRLSEAQRKAMEPLVDEKLREDQDTEITVWDEKNAVSHLVRYLL